MEKRIFKPEMLLILVLPILFSFLASSGASGSQAGMIGQFEIYLATATLTAILAFLIYLQKLNLALVAAVLIPLLYSVLILQFSPENSPIYILFIPILSFALITFFLLKAVFFNPAFLRFRTILFSILAGAGMTLYFFLQTTLMKQPLEPGFWVNKLVNSILLFIFIALGLSIADMVIVRREVAALKARERAAILNDEIDDEDSDAL
ncbi:MAG TPA: hypothetical protein P5533_03565 [Candidatus Cloacimonadota bacterium]|nr:hypothetical protein [Candidatus Cloacimonadota bacterium]